MTRMTLRPLLIFTCLLATDAGAVMAAQSQPGESTGMLGFTAEGVAKQQSLEQRFDALLDPADLRDWLKQIDRKSVV